MSDTSIVGTLNLEVGQTKTVNLDYTVPAGGTLPPASAPIASATAGVVTIGTRTGPQPDAGNPSAFTEGVPITGSAAGTTTVTATSTQGSNSSALLAIVTNPPDDVVAFEPNSIN